MTNDELRQQLRKDAEAQRQMPEWTKRRMPAIAASLPTPGALPEWLTDPERLAQNIYYTIGDGEGLSWQRTDPGSRDRCREMAAKITRYLGDASPTEPTRKRCEHCGCWPEDHEAMGGCF